MTQDIEKTPVFGREGLVTLFLVALVIISAGVIGLTSATGLLDMVGSAVLIGLGCLLGTLILREAKTT